MTADGTLPRRKPGTWTCAAISRYAFCRLGLSSSNGTSMASFTRVGLRVSTVLFTGVLLVAADSLVSVGVAGFEPTAPRSQSECATKLRHTPWRRPVYAVRFDARALESPKWRGRFAQAAVDSVSWRATPGQPGSCGRSSMVEPQSSKLITRV